MGWRFYTAAGEEKIIESAGVKPFIVGHDQTAPSTEFAVVANTAYLTPFVMGAPGTISGIWFWLTAAVGNYDVGVYTDAGVRVVSKGSTAAGTSWTEGTFAATLLAVGRYYLALAFNNAGSTLGVAPTGSARGLRVQRTVASSFPLPASIVPGSTRPASLFVVAAEIT